MYVVSEVAVGSDRKKCAAYVAVTPFRNLHSKP